MSNLSKRAGRVLKKLARHNGLTTSCFLSALLKEFTTLSLTKQQEIISDYYLSLSVPSDDNGFLPNLLLEKA